MRFVKGHGTANDFVVLPPGESTEVTPELVRALCDRRTGIGADGVLRVELLDSGGRDELGTRWFMDYRNADGGVAEMCGNGIRVFARFLVASGLERPGELRIGTRAGVKVVHVPPVGDVTVEMGPPRRLRDAKLTVAGQRYDGLGWSMGNPHLVALDVAGLDQLDLDAQPEVDPADAFPDGVNVELVQRVGDRAIRLRVHERGVGETRSCGTGACAAAVAAMAERDERATYSVDVPGGRLVVEWRSDGEVLLTGPAVLVASGQVTGELIGSG